MPEIAPNGMMGGPVDGLVVEGDERFLPPISRSNRVVEYVPGAEEAP